MNILYITPSFPKEGNGDNIYTDLATEISKKHQITVIVSEEKKHIKRDIIQEERGVEVIRVKTGNIYGVSFIEKGISFITLQYKLKKAIRKYLNNRTFDVILFMAPPVTLGNVVKFAMKKFNAKSYLMQKDIFPQNAIDLKVLNKFSPIYYYFKIKEKNIYRIATKIGCMSKENIKFLLNNNKWLDKTKLEILPNTIALREISKKKNNIRKKYGISEDKVIALYGGNFGKPQGIDFIIRVLDEYKYNEKVIFFFSGKGTERTRLYNYVKENNIKNVRMIEFLPKEDYNDILKESDIGLIFLDYRFTIPNIPSRTLAYFEYSLPIMAATDRNTDYKDILVNDVKGGLWCESNNIEDFKKQFDYLIENKEERQTMGKRGRKYLEDNWQVEKAVQIIESNFIEINEGENKI